MSFILLGILNSQAAGAVGGAGAYDLLETTVLGSSQSSVSFTSLNSTYGSTYKHLQLRATVKITRSGSATGLISMKINDDTSVYRSHELRGEGSSVTSSDLGSTTNLIYGITARNDNANVYAAQIVDILDPFDTSKNTTIRTLQGNTDSSQSDIRLTSGLYISTSAVDSIEIFEPSYNVVTGSRFSLYGLKESA